MAEYIYICDTCPFRTDDPMGVDGHENHAPVRGWLGHDESHRMYSRTELADAAWREASHVRTCWATHPGESHLQYVARHLPVWARGR